MPITPQKKIPELTSLANPRAALELFTAFQRLYEYIDFVVKQLQNDLTKQALAGKLTPEDINSLMGIFSQPLAGSNVIDPLLQSILQSFGPQNPNHVFAGPTPSFRPLTLADIPGGAGYVQIKDEGIILTARTKINFIGAGVTAVDNAGTTTTDVTIPGGGGGSSVNIFSFM